MAANATRVRAAQTQNTLCQLNTPVRTPASGRPMPPPIPSVALTRATPWLVFSGGSTALARLIPNGSTAMPNPCMARPMTRTSTLGESAAMIEPNSIMFSETTIMRRLPCMSPRRPITGLAIAPLSTAAVATQEMLPAEVCSSSGRMGSSGSATVWLIDTRAPQYPSTAIVRPGREVRC